MGLRSHSRLCVANPRLELRKMDQVRIGIKANAGFFSADEARFEGRRECIFEYMTD